MQYLPFLGTSLLEESNFLVQEAVLLLQLSHDETQVLKEEMGQYLGPKEHEFLQESLVFNSDHREYFAQNAIPETCRVEVQEAFNADFQAPYSGVATVGQDCIRSDQEGVNPDDANMDQEAFKINSGVVCDNPEPHEIHPDHVTDENSATQENRGASTMAQEEAMTCQEVIEMDERLGSENPEAANIEVSQADPADLVLVNDLQIEAQGFKSDADLDKKS